MVQIDSRYYQMEKSYSKPNNYYGLLDCNIWNYTTVYQ